MHSALIPKAKPEDIIAVDQFSREARTEIAKAQTAGNTMMQALITARAVQGLRELITDAMMTDIMGLMNSPLGFLTDRDPARPKKDGSKSVPYPVEVVKDCFITSRIWGASPVGNEWNIIADRAYRTVAYYRRKVLEVPGVTDVAWQISTPEYSQDGKVARLICACSWKQDGKPRRRVCGKDASGDWRISVRVNYGMGEAAVKGKAERAILALALAEMEGRAVDDADHLDPDDPNVINGEFTVAPTADADAGNPGDDIAADLHQQDTQAAAPPQTSPTLPVDNPASAKPREWWVEQLLKKTSTTAAAAWVKFAHESGHDITAEGDTHIKVLRAKRDKRDAA